MKRAASAAALALLGFSLCASAALAGSIVGPTPRAAALAKTGKYAAHEVEIHPNYPGLTYKVGTCKLLFRSPWTAWGCAYQIDGWSRNVGAPHECVVLKLALKRLSEAATRPR